MLKELLRSGITTIALDEIPVGITFVYFHVRRKVAVLREGFITYFAWVWTGICVCSRMHSQVAGPRECLVAYCAPIGAVMCVCSRMPSQVA